MGLWGTEDPSGADGDSRQRGCYWKTLCVANQRSVCEGAAAVGGPPGRNPQSALALAVVLDPESLEPELFVSDLVAEDALSDLVSVEPEPLVAVSDPLVDFDDDPRASFL